MPTVIPPASSVGNDIQALIRAVGDDMVLAYRNQNFLPTIVNACPDFYSVANAASWVNAQNFMLFVADWFQKPQPRTPQTHGLTHSSSPIGKAPYISVEQSPSAKRPQFSLSTDIDACPSSPTAHLTARRHSQPSQSMNLPEYSSESEADVPPVTGRKQKRKTKGEKNIEAGLIQVTRKLWVKRVVHLSEVPQTWEVPREGDSVAYILDLTNSAFEYRNGDGNIRSMAAIIKNKSTDAWGEGSGGSKKEGLKIMLLENKQGQRVIHRCRGSFPCSHADMATLDGYTHYEHDSETFARQHQSSNEASVKEQESLLAIAAA
ncbi:hypothetical protein M422DRAFT_241905 [Sphaerobolus stellatus SS14]|nr:hypothetical protein M422DRAFT_241905 [Sphaerobolus stellatus SS14]